MPPPEGCRAGAAAYVRALFDWTNLSMAALSSGRSDEPASAARERAMASTQRPGAAGRNGPARQRETNKAAPRGSPAGLRRRCGRDTRARHACGALSSGQQAGRADAHRQRWRLGAGPRRRPCARRCAATRRAARPRPTAGTAASCSAVLTSRRAAAGRRGGRRAQGRLRRWQLGPPAGGYTRARRYLQPCQLGGSSTHQGSVVLLTLRCWGPPPAAPDRGCGLAVWDGYPAGLRSWEQRRAREQPQSGGLRTRGKFVT